MNPSGQHINKKILNSKNLKLVSHYHNSINDSFIKLSFKNTPQLTKIQQRKVVGKKTTLQQNLINFNFNC